MFIEENIISPYPKFKIVCGNSWNDIEMLQCADIAISVGTELKHYHFNFDNESQLCDFLVEKGEELFYEKKFNFDE